MLSAYENIRDLYNNGCLMAKKVGVVTFKLLAAYGNRAS